MTRSERGNQKIVKCIIKKERLAWPDLKPSGVRHRRAVGGAGSHNLGDLGRQGLRQELAVVASCTFFPSNYIVFALFKFKWLKFKDQKTQWKLELRVNKKKRIQQSEMFAEKVKATKHPEWSRKISTRWDFTESSIFFGKKLKKSTLWDCFPKVPLQIEPLFSVQKIENVFKKNTCTPVLKPWMKYSRLCWRKNRRLSTESRVLQAYQPAYALDFTWILIFCPGMSTIIVAFASQFVYLDPLPFTIGESREPFLSGRL